MPNTFRNTLNITKAAIDRAEIDFQDRQDDRKRYSYHFPHSFDCCIKVQQGVSISNSPAIRGAIGWAIRQSGRQVTLTGGDGFLLV